jgi:hypothetical protein
MAEGIVMTVPVEHWRDYLDPPKYVKAFLLRGKDVTVTIERVERGVVEMGTKKSRKPMIYFRGKDTQPLVAGVRICDSIAGMYGKNPKDWIGKRITLYGTTTASSDGTVECVRVRPVPPADTVTPEEKAPNEPA